MIEATLIASGINKIAGCDEAGRGPCAGPLVVAAVILEFPLHEDLSGIADSKELSETKRESLFEVITERALSYSIIEISPEEIDSKGLHKCNLEGMRRAVSSLNIAPEYVLTDGYAIDGLEAPTLAVWKGDKVSINVGAASILAKDYRDRIMVELDKKYPGYGFADHKGYITAKHTAALNELGVTQIHRKSFANVASLLNK
jgi:ribonuclease HII